MLLIAATRRLVGLPLVCLACAAQQPADFVPPANRAAEWPECVAGRSRRIVTDGYVLYGRSLPAAAEKQPKALRRDSLDVLRRWLDAELPTIASRYRLPEGRGLILATGPGLEPDAALNDWRTRNVSRERRIRWTSEIRSQEIHTRAGRPYSFFHTCYFTENYSLPYEDALDAGILDPGMVKPAWIGVLTTDDHLQSAFRQKYGEHERKVQSEASASAGEWLMGAGVRLALRLDEPKYRSIDLQLMHLQRREALAKAIINASVEDDQPRFEALTQLQRDTDEAWQELWFRRPIE